MQLSVLDRPIREANSRDTLALPPTALPIFLAQAFDLTNAPANRGWMNMFRGWSRGFALDAEFQRTEPQFNKAFVYFFANDLRNRPTIDTDPIPHPWDEYFETSETLEGEIQRLKRVALERKPSIKLTRGEVAIENDLWESLKRRSNVFLDTGTIDPRGFGSPSSDPPLAEGATAKESEVVPEPKKAED